jgi:hypothetical protein
MGVQLILAGPTVNNWLSLRDNPLPGSSGVFCRILEK